MPKSPLALPSQRLSGAVQTPCQFVKCGKIKPLVEIRGAAGGAKSAACRRAPGKTFRLGDGKKVSVNHTNLPSIAKGSARAAVSEVGHAWAAQTVAVGDIMAKAKPKDEDEELDDEQDKDGEEGAEKPKGKFGWLKLPSFAMPSRKMMIIIAGAVVLLGGGGGGAYFFFFKGSAEHEKPVKEAAKPAIFVDMPDVLVNLANAANERTQYLKVKIVLEVPTAEVVTEIQPLMPRIMDAFQTYLRALRPTDLDGSAGLYRLREELTRRVNAAVAPARITAVLFKEIIVQ